MLYLAFLRLSVVNILSNFLVPLASVVDTAFLGHWAAVEDLAGVSLATVLFNYLYWTFGFLRMGTTGLTAQAVGQGDDRESQVILVRNGAIALGVGLGLVLLQDPLGWLGFHLLSGSEAVEAAGQAYYRSRAWGAPATLINFVLWGWFLGRAEGRWVLLLSALANGGNGVLDYGFIVVWGWGSGGAGLATALSQYLTLAAGLGLVARHGITWDRALWQRVWDPAAIARTVAFSRDILIRTFALVSVFAIFTNLSAIIGTAQHQGTTLLAANALLLQVVVLSAYLVDGLAFATESLVGQLAGQGRIREMEQLLRWAMGWGLGVSATIALGIVIQPRLLSLLTNHPPVLQLAGQTVGWLVPVLVIGSLAYVLDGYWLGLTEGSLLRRSALWASGLGFAPLALVAGLSHSIQILWGALVGFMVVRSLTLGWAVYDRTRSTPLLAITRH
ncbi:MATE family efflux transporter [Prochlorothrix hollandica]|uniref:MATE family efflux transporter n=1 Tax=Prochlorothrix hollandica TaxID=1223 RepID=UPI003340503E